MRTSKASRIALALLAVAALSGVAISQFNLEGQVLKFVRGGTARWVFRIDSSNNLDVVDNATAGRGLQQSYTAIGILGPVPSAETIAAGATITADACGGIKLVNAAAGGVTTDTTNTFTAPAAANDGCWFDMYNQGPGNITLDENDNFRSKMTGNIVLASSETVRISRFLMGGSRVWQDTGGTWTTY